MPKVNAVCATSQLHVQRIKNGKNKTLVTSICRMQTPSFVYCLITITIVSTRMQLIANRSETTQFVFAAVITVAAIDSRIIVGEIIVALYDHDLTEVNAFVVMFFVTCHVFSYLCS